MKFIQNNITDLKQQQMNHIEQIQLLNQCIKTFDEEYQKKCIETKATTDRITTVKDTMNHAKHEIEQRRQQIASFQNQITTKQQAENQIKGKISNVQENLLMISKSVTQLKADPQEQKKLHDITSTQKTRSAQDLQSAKSKIENLERDVERNENDRRRLDRDLQKRHQDLMETQRVHGQLKHNLDQHRGEIQSKKYEQSQYEQRRSVLIGSLEENRRKTKVVDTKIEETQRIIERQDPLKQTAEDKVRDSEREVQSKRRDLDKLDRNISCVEKQYNDVNNRQNKATSELSNVQNAKVDIGRRLTDNDRNLNERNATVNRLSHQATLKRNEIRNYKEKQSRYTLDSNENSSEDDQIERHQ
ncbi:unnamed protein product, partial [Rotaria magnacalcarata]